jgi:hypothetical protein
MLLPDFPTDEKGGGHLSWAGGQADWASVRHLPNATQPSSYTGLDPLDHFHLYICRASCQHTFRHYPEGAGQAQQSQRLRKLAAICWTLGLSYRGIGAILAVFGIGIA